MQSQQKERQYIAILILSDNLAQDGNWFNTNEKVILKLYNYY
jgi:hypothetical protein